MLEVEILQRIFRRINYYKKKIKMLFQENFFLAIFILSKKLFYFLMNSTIALLALFIALFLFLIRPLIKIKFVRLSSDRLGHYASNTELMLNALKSGAVVEKDKLFFYTLAGPLCNKQLHKMWKRVIPILPFSRVIVCLNEYLNFFYGETYSQSPIKFFERRIAVRDESGLLAATQQSLWFTQKEKRYAEKLLLQLGIPSGASFICLHARDALYLSKYLSDNNWSYHDYRDVDIDNYRCAALFLAEQGYYVLRMGKWVSKPFDLNHPRIIDYANHPLRSDFLDIYLTAHCTFFIATLSGLDSVAQIFRRPLLIVNAPPFYEVYTWWPALLFIPKNLIHLTTKKTLTFQETIQQLVLTQHPENSFLETLSELNIQFIENTADEILEATKEMLARLKGSWMDSPEEQSLQERFWQRFPDLPTIRPGHPSYSGKIHVRIGAAFLSKHQALLD